MRVQVPLLALTSISRCCGIIAEPSDRSDLADRTPRNGHRGLRELIPDTDKQRYNWGMSIVFNWNGDDLPDEVRRQMPEELQGLPTGRYLLESVDDAPELTDADEAGIQAAMDSLRAGRGVPLDAARARIDRILKK